MHKAMFAHAHALAVPGRDQAEAGAKARRLGDCLVALAALACLLPAMVAIAIGIWLESGGPIFFSQTRLGQGGRHFRLHKFRKFHPRAQKDGLALTIKGDPRMTRVGRALERTKLDELPQLWNILVGEMAVVGPRPESLAFAACFKGGYARVLDHKPGIFGPCQVLFRNENSFYLPGCDPEGFYRRVLFPLKGDIDLAYFPHRSLAADAGWAARNVLAVIGWPLLPQEAAWRLDAVEEWLAEFKGDRLAVSSSRR